MLDITRRKISRREFLKTSGLAAGGLAALAGLGTGFQRVNAEVAKRYLQ